MLFLLCVGALTSNTTKYSYRSWELEQMESYDPFDPSGVSILYYLYNNIIIKVGLIISSYASWCSDRVRNFVDNFSHYIYIFPSILGKFFSTIVITWAEYWVCLFEVLCVASMHSYVFFYKSINTLLYDPYTSNLELWFFLQFAKLKKLNILNLEMFFCTSNFFHIGTYTVQLLNLSFFIDLTFYCSMLNINYPYMWLCLLKYFKSIYIMGVFYSISENFYHRYLGFLYIFSIIECIYSTRLYYLPTHIIDGFFVKCILSNQHICYLLYKCLGVVFYIIILKGFYYLYNINTDYDIVQYSHGLVSRVLFPYSFFLFELLFNIFKFVQWYGSTYILVDCDTYKITIKSKIMLLYAYHIVSLVHIYDIITPLCSFINHISLNLDYYGNLGVYMPLARQSIVFSILHNVSFLYIYMNMLYKAYTSFIVCAYSFSLLLYISIYNMLFILYLYKHVSNYSICINIQYLNTFYVFDYSNMWCPKSFVGDIIICSNLFIVCNYVDLSTYFLTGTYCRSSEFMARHRYAIGIGYSF